MLKKLMTVFRTLLARRTIAAIAGEIQKKIERLDKAEAALLSHVGLTEDNVAAAKVALIALEEKAKAEIAALVAKAGEANALRNKLK
jgi:hypothetical protein